MAQPPFPKVLKSLTVQFSRCGVPWSTPTILPGRSLHQRFRSQNNFPAFSFDYLRPSCEIPRFIKTRHPLLTNLLIRGKVVPLTGDVVVVRRQMRGCLSLRCRGGE